MDSRSRADGSATPAFDPELLRGAMDLSNDAFFLIDVEQMRYIHLNKASYRLLKMTPQQVAEIDGSVLRASQRSFRHITEAAIRRAYDEAVAQSPQIVRTEAVLVDHEGNASSYDIDRLAFQSNGRWALASWWRDSSERRRAQKAMEQRLTELARSNEELERFAYVISHDLSEPLRMMGSYAQLLSKRYSRRLDADGRQFLGYMVGGAQRMMRLIDDLLLYSRAGRPGAQVREVRLDEALDEALANLAQAISSTGARIERKPLPAVLAERVAMVQLFQNLVGNSLKFRGDAAPLVQIEAAEQKKGWEITVRDNGIGIAPEYRERVFVLFQRLHAREQYEGTGIGLAICKKIVERHGGTIRAQSHAGPGTEFRFTLSRGGPAAD